MGQLLFIPFSSAGSAPTPSSVLNIYLSGANGDDAFDGLTPATAKATPAGVWSLFPEGLAGPLVVHVGAAGVVGDDTAYDWSTMPAPSQLNATARIWLYGDGAGQPGEDGFEVITTGAAAAGTDANQITLAAPITTNEYQHYTIEMTSGPAAGFRRVVQSNTTTSIIPCRRYEDQAGATGAGTTPVDGDTFRIIRPSAIFAGISPLEGQPGFLGGLGRGDGFAPLFLVNVAFASVTGTPEINGCTLYAAGVEFRGTSFPTLVGCDGSIGWWDNLNTSNVSRQIVQLPRSAAISLAKAEWFEDIGLTGSLVRLAEWRGWGASAPDITAATSSEFALYDCQMSGIGTFARVAVSGAGNTAWGGYFWGGLSLQGNSYLGVLAQNAVVGTSGVVFRSTVVVANYSTLIDHAPTILDSATSGFSIGIGSFAALFGGTATNTTGLALDCFEDAHVETISAWTITSGSSGVRIYSNSSVQLLVGPFTVNSQNQALQVLSNSFLLLSVALNTFTSVAPSGNNTVSMFAGGRILRPGASLVSITGGALSMLNDCVYEASGTTISSPAACLTLTKNSSFTDEGTSSFTGTGSTTPINVTESKVSFSALTVINTGGATAVSLTYGSFRNSSTLTTTGGISLLQKSDAVFAGAATIGGNILATQSSVYQGAAVSVTTSSASPGIWLTTGSSYQQAAGSLTVSSSASDGVSCASESQAYFLGGASSAISGAGGGNVGVRARGGSRIWFNAAPSSVLGPAGADLVVGGNAAVANGTLAAADNFITDTDVTGLLGGGNVIGRVT